MTRFKKLLVPFWLKMVYTLEKNPGISKTRLAKKINCTPATTCENIRLILKLNVIKVVAEKGRREHKLYLTCKSQDIINIVIYNEMKEY